MRRQRMSDLISRNKLKEDLIKFFPTDCLDGIESKTLFNQILHDIDNAPTVEAFTRGEYEGAYLRGYVDSAKANERPKGKWLPRTSYDGFTYWRCDKCRVDVDETTDYCPHCGADMKESE